MPPRTSTVIIMSLITGLLTLVIVVTLAGAAQ